MNTAALPANVLAKAKLKSFRPENHLSTTKYRANTLKLATASHRLATLQPPPATIFPPNPKHSAAIRRRPKIVIRNSRIRNEATILNKTKAHLQKTNHIRSPNEPATNRQRTPNEPGLNPPRTQVIINSKNTKPKTNKFALSAAPQA
jgi:hypothetical protein